MAVYADLHVHSKYSRATSRDMDLPHIEWWARRKGVGIVGTGDFTHPAWRRILGESLVEVSDGFFSLRDDLQLAGGGPGPRPSFVLQTELSLIYRRGGRSRRVHMVVLAPDFDAVDAIIRAVGPYGKLESDGRPMLSLDTYDLLSMLLDIDGRIFMFPAHAWTPWYAIFGSKSGFDSLEEALDDLSVHITALETGLSSDPPMNRMLSDLDRLFMVSFSDAHSPRNLAREVTIFDEKVNDYNMLINALRTGDGLLGTVEYHPEEGKYHYDGHRACGVRLTPREARELGGRCPVCGRPLTLGTLHRIDDLADRAEPENVDPFTYAVPLPVLVSQAVGVKSMTSKKVQRLYGELLKTLDASELDILLHRHIPDIERVDGRVALAVRLMREGRLDIQPGYDGEYGTVRVPF